jgi:phosphohistidine phosphatase
VKLVIIRHGPAGDREEWQREGHDDRQRPLTLDGKKRMREAVGGLATVVASIDVLAASPLVRAEQSAEIVADEFGVQFETLDALIPDREPNEAVQWLHRQAVDATIAIVGHEPHLSVLIGYLLVGKPHSFISLKKAGVCLLDLADGPNPGGGTLEWLLTPRVLRRL